MIKTLFIVFILFSSVLFATEPSQITYLTEDYPPENFVKDGQLQGYAVDILKAIWKKMGVPEQPILVYPWARAYETLKNKPNSMLFAMARTPERELLFKWVGPIFSARVSLFCLQSADFRIQSLNDARKFRIGVVRNDIGHSLLSEAGFPKESLSEATRLDQLLHMVALGRIDLVCTTENSLRELLSYRKDLKFPHKEAALVGDTQVYYALSKNTDQALVDRFQAALNSIDSVRKETIRMYKRSE